MAHSITAIGQILRFEEVTKLPSIINSDSEESMPLVSSDGRTMYFIRSFFRSNRGGKFAGQDIWMSQKEDSIWSDATNHLGVLNNKKNNAVIGLGDDGITLYLLDSYGGTVHGIAFSRFFNNKWTKPEKISIKGLSKDGYIGFYMNPSFDVLLISMSKQDSYGNEDLYVSLKDSTNRWSEPRNLGATINSSGYEISPFLSSDKKFLFYASDGHPGFGDADIFVSERLYNSWDIWSVPKNLGPVINSVHFDAYFSINKDSLIYFVSNKDNGYSDIFQSSLIVDTESNSKSLIERLSKEANALLHEFQSITKRNTKELIIFFEYNKFSLGEEEKSEIELILAGAENINEVLVQLLPFSFEEYADLSKDLINSKREQSIREFLVELGVATLDISSMSNYDKPFNKFSGDNVGGVRVKISY
jgi:WD40-like Beta Propeller Repeat